MKRLFMKCIYDTFAILLTFGFDCRVLKKSQPQQA